MFQSWKIGNTFGIPLYVHWTFWLLPAWILFLGMELRPLEMALNLGVLLAAFGCVVLHELGHALTARRFGIDTRDITLYPIGGVARLERMSEKPSEELWIAVAGPAVNLVIAAALTALLVPLGTLLNPSFVFDSLAGAFLFRLLLVNVIMVLFNLLPAFPMDGGRVLRAVLALQLGQLRATRIAVMVGIGMALLFAVVGMLVFQNPWMLAIAFFVFVAGQAELQAVYYREHQRRLQALHGWPVSPRFEDAEDASHQPESVVFPPRPKITVYSWDPATERWIREAGSAPGQVL